MGEKWHGGKGDKSRISDSKKYHEGMERIYGRKSWKFWAVWEGYDLDTVEFNSKGIDESKKISYTEYRSRFLKGNTKGNK